MTKTYTWTEDAEKAIREHFQNRNAARAIKSRVYLKKRFQKTQENGDMVYTFTYKGETATMTRQAYSVKVDF